MISPSEMPGQILRTHGGKSASAAK